MSDLTALCHRSRTSSSPRRPTYAAQNRLSRNGLGHTREHRFRLMGKPRDPPRTPPRCNNACAADGAFLHEAPKSTNGARHQHRTEGMNQMPCAPDSDARTSNKGQRQCRAGTCFTSELPPDRADNSHSTITPIPAQLAADKAQRVVDERGDTHHRIARWNLYRG